MREIGKRLASQYLAVWARLVLHERRPRIVGVTGSVGKTTTKEAIFSVLADPKARMHLGVVGKSSGNLNTEIGLPLAVLCYERAPENVLTWLWLLVSVPFRALFLVTVYTYPTILVLEYAADRPGDIRRLVKLAPPTVGIVTAVGPAHLERFGSIDTVAREKAAILTHLPPSGLAIVARDNSHTAAMTHATHAPIVKVSGRGRALAQAVAQEVGSYFGVPKPVVTHALRQFADIDGRLQTKKIGQWTVINDTYNANPLSMELALDTLKEQAPSGKRRVAFLGTMRELGAESERYHIEIGKYAKTCADVVIGVGPYAQLYDGIRWFATSTEAAAALFDILESDDYILVKGSRGVTMERIIEAIGRIAKESHGNN